MKILDEGLAAQLKGKWQVYDAPTVRSAWQAITDYAHIQLLCVDDEYRALKLEDWIKVMKNTDTSSFQYTPHFFDCNSFACAYKAEVSRLLVNGCGLVLDFSARHAFNLALIAGKKKPEFKFIEPQQSGDAWINPNSRPCYNLKGQGLVYL